MHRLARALLPIVVVLAFLAPAAGARAAPDYSATDLDGLFSLLKDAPDAATATAISDEIWTRWTEPGDAIVAATMATLLDKRREYDLRTALDLANELVLGFPDYAEGWNQRATLQHMMGNDEAALADIAATLEREPRHFGALAGRAMILLKRGDEAGAHASMVEAIAINPFLSERGLFPDLGQPPTRT